MKTLKQIKEEYDNITLDQMPEAPEDLMLEGREAVSIKSNRTVPSFNQMPSMLLFRRIAYRLYPNKQVVALYYSKMVDKYLSIPFGPDGNLNLSESTVYNTLEELDLEEGAKWEATKGAIKGALHGTIRGGAIGGAIAPGPGTAIGAVVGGVRGAYKGAKSGYEKGKNMEEDWQDVNRKDKTDGLSQAAVNAYRRENPGSKLKTAVTEKNPTGKRASRRKSFCSRMGGMKKRLTSAKTARDPDSRINKALRRWNCEEGFKVKLDELRMQQNEGVMDYVDKGAEMVVPYYSAGKKVYKGDYKGAAKDAAVDTALLATGAIAGKALGAGARLLSKFRKGSKVTPKTPAVKAPKPKKTPVKSAVGGAAAGAGAAASLASKAADALASGGASGAAGDAITKSRTDLIHDRPGPKTFSGAKLAKDSGGDEVFHSKYKASISKELNRSPQQNENSIVDIRNMINEGNENMDLEINGRTITLNTSMAKRILEVYDSVNTKNKKIVESMLNEDLESFKKLLNFSIKV